MVGTSASDWDASSSSYEEVATEITGYMANKALAHHSALWSRPGEGSIDFLDVAAGPGYFTKVLSAKLQPTGKQYCISCTDYSQGMLDLAKKAIDDPNVKIFIMDGQDMSAIQESSMDGVNCMFGIMFMPEYQKCLDEMKRVLKPGGKATVGTWADAGLLRLGDAFGQFLGALEPGELSTGQKFMQVGKHADQMEANFKAAGFSEVSVVRETYVLSLTDMTAIYKGFVGNAVLSSSLKTGKAGAREPTPELFQEFLSESPLGAPFRAPEGKPGYTIEMICNLAVALA